VSAGNGGGVERSPYVSAYLSRKQAESIAKGRPTKAAVRSVEQALAKCEGCYGLGQVRLVTSQPYSQPRSRTCETCGGTGKRAVFGAPA
jgi:DnaJ-class molecular chaperone